MKYGLTTRQQEVLQALVAHHEKTGQMPTLRELITATGGAPETTGNMHRMLRRLEDKGWIKRLAGQERGIALL